MTKRSWKLFGVLIPALVVVCGLFAEGWKTNDSRRTIADSPSSVLNHQSSIAWEQPAWTLPEAWHLNDLTVHEEPVQPLPDPALLDVQPHNHPPAVCFAPGTPADVVEAFTRTLFDVVDLNSRFNLLCRWSGTQGSPRALTWSFPPDGVSIPGQGTGPTGPNEIFSKMDSLFASQGGRATWIARFEDSFDRFAQLSGLTYTQRTNSAGDDWDDGAAWGATGGSFRGDIRIGMRQIDGGFGILAFNNFPCSTFTGDMVLDRDENWAQGSFNNNLFLRNIIQHEHGHGVGVLHVCPLTNDKLMEPFLNTNFDGLRHDEVRAIQRHYGDLFEPDNSAAAATDLGTLEVGLPINLGRFGPPAMPNGATLSIDANAEQDYFRFTLVGTRSVSASVTPIGLTYDSSTQQAGGGCNSGNIINSLTFANLNIQVIDTDGFTVLATGDSAPAGEIETAETDLLDPGVYYARVYEGNSPLEPQLYNLALTAIGPDCEEPIALADGSRTILVTPIGTASLALLVTGDGGDPQISCVSTYIQADGTLGPDPVFQTPEEWETIDAHGLEIMPSKSYTIQGDCGSAGNPLLSSPASATTWVWADVAFPPDDDAGFLDILQIIKAFKQDFSEVTLARADIEPCVPDRDADFLDALDGVRAFKDRLYTDFCDPPCGP